MALESVFFMNLKVVHSAQFISLLFFFCFSCNENHLIL